MLKRAASPYIRAILAAFHVRVILAAFHVRLKLASSLYIGVKLADSAGF